MTTPRDDPALEALIRGSAVPLAALDTASSQLVGANEPFVEALRMSSADVVDLTLAELLPPDHHPPADELLTGLRSGSIESWRGRGPLQQGDGGELDIPYRVGTWQPAGSDIALITLETGPPANPELTARESEVLRLLMDGHRVPAIARAVFLSESTVRNHLSAVYRKYGVHSQDELLAKVQPPKS